MNRVTVYFKDSSMKNVYVDDVEKLDKKGVSFILDSNDNLVFNDSDMSTPSEEIILRKLSNIKQGGRALVDVDKVEVDESNVEVPRIDNNNVEREDVTNSVYMYKASISYNNHLVCKIKAETRTTKTMVDAEGYKVTFVGTPANHFKRCTYTYYDFTRMMVNIAKAMVGLPFTE